MRYCRPGADVRATTARTAGVRSSAAVAGVSGMGCSAFSGGGLLWRRAIGRGRQCGRYNDDSKANNEFRHDFLNRKVTFPVGVLRTLGRRR
jgi:hypothetical protein